MGATASKEAEESSNLDPINTTTTKDNSNKICENCVKSKQVELPSTAAAASCGEQYVTVDECMKQNAGQISACVNEWKAFQLCHENHNAQQATAEKKEQQQHQ